VSLVDSKGLTVDIFARTFKLSELHAQYERRASMDQLE
jgi:hypothetical protein